LPEQRIRSGRLAGWIHFRKRFQLSFNCRRENGRGHSWRDEEGLDKQDGAEEHDDGADK